MFTQEQLKAMDKNSIINEFLAMQEKMEVLLNKGDSRKDQVLALLQAGPMSIDEIAEKLNIQTKNVSTVLSGLKKDGVLFGTDPHGRKVLYPTEEPAKAEETPVVQEEVAA